MGTPGHVRGFAGMAAAEEPRAALVARDILSSGGTAADAAAAMGFALAVTLPSAAGLDAGGACVVYDAGRNVADSITFMAPGGLPGLARGLFALHAKYGKLRWEAVVMPAESLARFGTAPSRALLNDVAAAAGAGRSDAIVYFGSLKEGVAFSQIELAALLARLRVKGPGEIHIGEGAGELAAAINAAGGRIDPAALRSYQPAILPPRDQNVGSDVAHFVPGQPTARAGASTAQTGYAVIDSYGNQVACGLTMGRPFGTGRFAPGTGMLVADLAGAGLPAVAVVANHNTKEPRLAIAATEAAAGAVAATIEARNQFKPAPLAQTVTAGTDLNAVSCVSGGASANRCDALTDPKGNGLAVFVGR